MNDTTTKETYDDTSPPLSHKQLNPKTKQSQKPNKSGGNTKVGSAIFRIGSGVAILSVLLVFCFPEQCRQAVEFTNYNNLFCFGNYSQGFVGESSGSEEGVGGCDESVCSIEGDFMGFDVTPPFLQKQDVEAPAILKDHTQKYKPQEGNSDVQETQKIDDSTKWWKEDLHLWKMPKTPQDFDQQINQKGIVVVDYFAVWCNGCKRIHTDLNVVAQQLSQKCTFIKVNVDGMRQIVHREGVKSLPYIQIYRDGNPLFEFQAVPWKVKYLQQNLQLALKNWDKGIELDANGVGKLVELEIQQQQLQKNQFQQQQQESKNQAVSSDEPLLQKMVKSSQQQSEPRLDISLDLVEEKSVPVKDEDFIQRKQQFLKEFGDDYGYDGRIEQLYAEEVAPRMAPHEHYMDYTGASVYCNSQLKASLQELESNMFGNPHSANPSSKLTEERVEEVRDLILQFFGADPAEYQAVFTKSATGALQIVGETFPWGENSKFRYLTENHNSVLGIREYAMSNGANFEAVDESWVEDWIAGKLNSEHPLCGNESNPTYSLFAFPGEDNFAGVKYPLSWIKKVQSQSHPGHKWLTLLDAAAYVPTQPLNLTETPADFVAISFYKMFGYPTGIGALILRTEHADILQKTFWGGGAVSLVTSQKNFRVLKCKPSEKLEDGTVAFLDIINLKHGFNLIEELGGIQKVQAHVRSLTKYLYQRLHNLKHSNGRSMLLIFGKHHLPNSHEVQGGILNFEVITPSGQIFSYKKFEQEAAESGFHVRTGAECNPGACYKYLGVEEHEIQKLAEIKQGCQDDVEFVEVEKDDENSVLGSCGKQVVKVPLGSVRTSLGYMSTFEDCEEFARFVEKNYKDREC